MVIIINIKMRSTFNQINKYLHGIECEWNETEWNENDMHKYLSIDCDAIIFGYPVHLDQVPRSNSGMSIKECSFSLHHWKSIAFVNLEYKRS